MSSSLSGSYGNDQSHWPRITPSGEYIAFYSWASNLIPLDLNGHVTDVFVYEPQIGPIDTDGDGVFDPDDLCPEDPFSSTSISYIGDLSVTTSAGESGEVSLSAIISSDEGPVPGQLVFFELFDSEGLSVEDCSSPSDSTGWAGCSLTGLPPELYRIDVSSFEVTGCYAAASDEAYLVIYDPDQPRAAGGGFFYPDTESTQPALSADDKAHFCFVVYINQQSEADGNLEFQDQSAGVSLKSEAIEWYTLSNNLVIFEGVGRLNGQGTYTFRVQATDGDNMGDPVDHFNIVIWDGTDTETDPIHRAKNELAGGNIAVHKK